MSKLLCPKCTKTITLPDDFSGGEVTCPSCTHTFPAPTRYTPTVLADPPAPVPIITPTAPAAAAPPVTTSIRTTELPSMTHENPLDRPAPPPGLVLTAPAGAPSAALALPAGYTKSHGFALSPRLFAWLPAICITIAFVCTFFPWVGTFVGSNVVDSQSPWGAMFGATPNRNFDLEKAMKTPDNWLDKLKSDWQLMLPCLLALVAAVVLAWIDRAVHTYDSRGRAYRDYIWKRRHAIVAVLATFSLFLMLIQIGAGFGLDRAVRETVTEQFAAERQEAAGSRAKLAVVDYNEEQAYAKFNLKHTYWLYLGVGCNFLAVLTMLCRLGLDQRGTKPPPRIVIQY